MRLLTLLTLIALSQARSIVERAIQPMYAGEERRFTCEFDDFGRDEFGTDFYSCIVEEDSGFGYTIANVIGTNGDHSGGKNNADVEALVSDGAEFALLPSGAGSVFPNLVALHITRAGLKHIKANDIRVFPNLEYFSVPENEILYLENGLFNSENNEVLAFIDLRYNAIAYVDEEAFDEDLEELHTLLLEGIICDFEDYDEDAEDDSDDVWDLVDIALEYCTDVTRLQSVFSSVIRNYIIDLEECYGEEYYDDEYSTEDPLDCEELEELYEEMEGDLDSCEGDLEDLEEENEFLREQIFELNNPIDDPCRFKDTPDGYACSGNEIEITDEFDKDDYDWEGEHYEDGFTDARVRVFMLSFQETVLLPNNVAEFFANIHTYIVYSSGLEEIWEGDFDGLEGLRKLVITGNAISSIDQGVFDGLGDLEEIDMSDNGIGFFPNRAFNKLFNLVVLDISDNRITHIRNDIIPSTNAIEEFYAGGNRIAEMDVIFLWKLNKAIIVDFSDNPCDFSYDISDYDDDDEDMPSFKEFFDEVSTECH